MKKIKITWKAFGDKPDSDRFISSVEFLQADVVTQLLTDQQICEQIYAATNTYSGPVWDVIEPLLKDFRTHTSLSVGDEIEIGGKAYICADFGFIKAEDAEIKFLPDDYGVGAVFAVYEKVKA